MKLFIIILLLTMSLFLISANGPLDMSMDSVMGIHSADGGGPASCGAGYDELTGSDSNAIKDSTGGAICCPQ